MKKIVFFTCLFLITQNITKAQVAIGQLPTYTGKPSGGYVPIVIGGSTKKIDAKRFGIDTIYFASDTLKYKKGDSTVCKKLPSTALPYKYLVGYFTQSGSNNAPSVVSPQNTLSAAIVWTYNSTGSYTGTLANEFVSGKTFIFPNVYADPINNFQIRFSRTTANTIIAQCYQISTGSPIDFNNGVAFEIRVYN